MENNNIINNLPENEGNISAVNAEMLPLTEDSCKNNRITPLEPPKTFKLSGKTLALLSFSMPFFICAVVYLIGGYFPVGDKQILVTDFWHQYFPMVRELRETIAEGGSLLWNWHSGMGTNFLSMIGYYCASPLNLLTLFLPEGALRIGLTVITFSKIGLCGLTFSIFLMRVFKKRDCSVIFFSCLYATCACIMGYYWNIMWLDSIAMFPLVILGAVLLIRDKRPLLYTVSLALSLIFNYYIGIYICIAVAILSVGITVITWTSLKESLRTFFRMLSHSFIGIAISAVLILPCYMALQNSYYIDTQMKEEIWNGSLTQFLSALYPFQYPNTKALPTPNLCCGLVCIFLFIMFLFSRAKVREKICACFTLGFLFFSFLYSPLDFMWNGFHYVNMIPFRYSFIFSFVLVVCAFRAYCLLDKSRLYHIPIALGVTAIGACLLWGYLSTTVVLLCCGLALVYTMALTIYHFRLAPARFCGIAMCAIISIECAVAGAFGISEYSEYSSYLTHSKPVNELFNSINESGFYRTEMTDTKTLNDPLLYGYNGVSQFSSGANGNVSAFMKTVGVGGSPAGNRYVYYHSTPLINSTLAINYLISTGGENSNDICQSEVKTDDLNNKLFKNNYPLPIAFAVDERISFHELDQFSPFRSQNTLFSSMTGLGAPLFTEMSLMKAEATGGNIRGANGNYRFTATTEEVELKFTITCNKEGPYYIYPKIHNNNLTRITVIQNENNTVTFNYKVGQAAILPAGYHNVGDTITVVCTMEGDTEEYVARLNYAIMDLDLFEEGYSILNANGMTEVKYTDTTVSGKITAAEPTTLYTSIPFEKGWRAYIDGKRVTTRDYAGAFVCLDLPMGEHDIRFEYTPAGFNAGILISILGIIACVFSTLTYRKKKEGLPTEDGQPAQVE